MGKTYGKQDKEVKCAECGQEAKVYDLRSKAWWCVPDFLVLLKDYRDGNEREDAGVDG
jgi:hypothetical protein